MAVKLIRSGNSIFPKQLSCPTCGALIEIESAGDLKISNPTKLSRVPCVDCPDCGNLVSINGPERELALAERDHRSVLRVVPPPCRPI